MLKCTFKKQTKKRNNNALWGCFGGRVVIQFFVETINRRKDNFSSPTVQFVINSDEVKRYRKVKEFLQFYVGGSK